MAASIILWVLNGFSILASVISLGMALVVSSQGAPPEVTRFWLFLVVVFASLGVLFGWAAA